MIGVSQEECGLKQSSLYDKRGSYRLFCWVRRSCTFVVPHGNRAPINNGGRGGEESAQTVAQTLAQGTTSPKT